MSEPFYYVGDGVVDLAETTVEAAAERLEKLVVDIVGDLVPAASMDELEVLFGEHGKTLVTMTSSQIMDLVNGLRGRVPSTQEWYANLQQLTPDQVADVAIARWNSAAEAQAEGIARRAEVAKALAGIADNTLKLGIAVGLAALTGGASAGASGLFQAALEIAAAS